MFRSSEKTIATYKPMIQCTVWEGLWRWVGGLGIWCVHSLPSRVEPIHPLIFPSQVLRTGVRRGRLASRCSDCVPVRILPVGLPFPLAFHVELKGLRMSSAGQSRVGEEGTRGSVMALAGQDNSLVCEWIWEEWVMFPLRYAESSICFIWFCNIAQFSWNLSS